VPARRNDFDEGGKRKERRGKKLVRGEEWKYCKE
jgi:hypothetical protein